MRLKQTAEKEEMRIEQLQKQLTLKRELAMNKAKLQAIAEEFGETAKPTADLLRLLPEEIHGVERFLAEQPVEAVPVDTCYSTHVSSVSFGVSPAPTFADNPARDVPRSINQPTITAPAVTQISAPVMTSLVGGNLPATTTENQPTSMPSMNGSIELSTNLDCTYVESICIQLCTKVSGAHGKQYNSCSG